MKIEVYSPTIRRKEMSAVLTAMAEDKIGPGEQALSLIQTARENLKFDYCLALRSPVIALHLALKTLSLERGQGVIISALSPLYYTRVIEDMGLVPLFCDVQSPSFCMGRETVEKALNSRPELNVKCTILHHTLGFLPEGPAIAELGIQVIEDRSQSYGSVIIEEDDEESGESSAPASSGADGAKNPNVFTILGLEERDLLTSGGGALLYSMSRKDSASLRGLGVLPSEYGLPDMNAALAAVQFREAEKNLAKRKEIAGLYTQSLLRTRHRQFSQNGYNNYSFPLVLETGLKDVRTYARRNDIAVESAFEQTPAGSGMCPPEQCPEAYSLSLRTVLFPLYPRLSSVNAGKVAKLILTLP